MFIIEFKFNTYYNDKTHLTPKVLQQGGYLLASFFKIIIIHTIFYLYIETKKTFEVIFIDLLHTYPMDNSKNKNARLDQPKICLRSCLFTTIY